MTDIDIESEEGAQEKVDAHEELDNPHAESASLEDLDDVGGVGEALAFDYLNVTQ